MSITTIKLAGKKDRKTGAELPWNVNARHLPAEKYPNLPHGTVKVGKVDTKVAQIPILPSNVTATEASAYEDVVTEAGDKFQAWVVRSRNEQVRDAAEAGAKASARDLRVYDGAPITFDGTRVDIYTEQESTGRISGKEQAANALARVEALEGASDAEKLAMLMAEVARLAGK